MQKQKALLEKKRKTVVDEQEPAKEKRVMSMPRDRSLNKENFKPLKAEVEIEVKDEAETPHVPRIGGLLSKNPVKR